MGKGEQATRASDPERRRKEEEGNKKGTIINEMKCDVLLFSWCFVGIW